jgi:PPP family 3-phenylpropionic acid transporter
VQALHALTFGAFYTAGVALVDRESPPEVRASAQGLFSIISWGLACSASLALAGWLQSRTGTMRDVFLAAAAAALFAAVLAFRLLGQGTENSGPER